MYDSQGISRGARRALVAVTVTLLSAAMGRDAVADPLSDVFQPDVFRTGPALARRLPEYKDPLGRDCDLPAAPLTLSAAVDLALCRNPNTRSAWATAQQQAAVLGAAEGAYLPTVAATGTETRTDGRHVDVDGLLSNDVQNTRDAALNLSWTLYDFGARGGHLKSARRLLDAAAATVNYTAQQTVLAVVQGFYGVVAGDAGLVAAKTTEAADERGFEIARALRDGGVATLADVLQAETAYQQAVLARVQAQGAAATARGTLAVVLGLPADQPLRLDAEPVPAEVPALSTRMADLMAEAMRQRPDLAAARAQRDAAAANVTVARAAGRPTISVSAGRDLVDTTGEVHQNYNILGVSVAVPIFSGFGVDYSVRQAQAVLRGSDASLEQSELNVSLTVWNAYYGLDTAITQLAVTGKLVQTAEENEQVALGRYQSGVGTIIDLLTAQTAAGIARQTRITAEYTWQSSRAQLALALGRLSGTQPLALDATLP